MSVRAAFDAQVRRHPHPDSPRDLVEADGAVVRVVSADGWCGVTWSGLDAGTADAAIAAQIARFAAAGRSWEWKYYSYDEPPDLPERLAAHGFAAEPPETLLVAPVGAVATGAAPPAGVELRQVTDTTGVAALVRVHDEVFGGDHAELGRALLPRLAGAAPPVVAVVAYAGDRPVSGARIELPPGSEFASLWGGGTLPEWRGRGIFRALVARRAGVAAARGYRYLYVDASPDSRPILERLGFTALATTTPYVRTA